MPLRNAIAWDDVFCPSLEALEDRDLLCASPTARCLPDFPDPAPVAVQRAANAVNEFAFDLYEHYLKEEGNVFLSPFSIAAAFGMAYAGAGSHTAAEIEEVFHFGEEPGIHDSFRELLQFREGGETPQFIWDGIRLGQSLVSLDNLLSVANGMWPAVGFEPSEEFVARLTSDYAAESQAVDFTSPSARETINEWTARKTSGFVEELLKPGDVDPETRLVLTNTVQFASSWAVPFDPSVTRESAFKAGSGEVSVAMMRQEGGFRFTERDGFDVLEMPYLNGGTSMVVLVPQEGRTADDLKIETLIEANEWLASEPEASDVGFLIPKFKTSVASNLVPVLGGMGMPSAFSPGADFSKIAGGLHIELHIEPVRHEAGIEINEQGTIASAATALVFRICFAAGTPIRTPTGSKPIEDLKVGDIVLARDENNPEGKPEPKIVEDTFKNRGEIVQLKVGGQSIETTSEHPFFAKDKGWTPCNQLEAGDLLLSETEEWKEVESVHATREMQTVYNMRVADHHTYFVGGDEWGFSVWAHNSDGCGPCKTIVADKPFHFFIRDNATTAMLFMGRIDDPTQENNSLVPSVSVEPEPEALPGDANGDSEVGFQDFLLLSKYFGQATDEAIRTIDFNDDGQINFADFLILQANFGRSVAVS